MTQPTRRAIDLAAAERWVGSIVRPAGRFELAKERPWASVWRVPVDEGSVWFKACRPVQAFEPRLTAELSARWPDRVAVVLGYDTDHAWLLTADAGRPVTDLGNPPDLWLRALPRYAELQRGETLHVGEHLHHGVPDLRLPGLPTRYEELLGSDLPLEPDEVRRLRRFAPRFGSLCEELATALPVESVQHDDLHLRSLFTRDDELRVLDWGDASIDQPFASLVVTFRFLEEQNGLPPADPWFDRLRDAYLEPWGRGLAGAFELAMRVGMVAHAFTWHRHRVAMAPADRIGFDRLFADTLRWVMARAVS